MTTNNKTLIPKASKMLTARQLKMLGKKTDREIAAINGICSSTVFNTRRTLGIPKFNNGPATLPKAAIKLLGKRFDSEIASRFQWSASFVSTQRRRLGIPRYKPMLPPSVLARLGKEPDSLLAQRTGLNKGTIYKLRQQHGIALFNDRTRAPLPLEQVRQSTQDGKPRTTPTETHSRESLMLASHRLQLETLGEIKRTNLPDAAIKLLGKKTDLTLAAKYKVSARTIYRARIIRDIKKCSAQE